MALGDAGAQSSRGDTPRHTHAHSRSTVLQSLPCGSGTSRGPCRACAGALRPPRSARSSLMSTEEAGRGGL